MGLQTICFFSLFNFSFCQRDCGENDWKQIKIFSAGVSLSYHSSIELWCVFLFFSLCSSVRLSLFHFEIHLLSPVPCHISSTDLSVPPSPFYFIYFSSCNAPPPQPPAALILPPGRLSLTALQFVAFILVRFAHCELSTGRLLRESSFSFLLFVAVTLM